MVVAPEIQLKAQEEEPQRTGFATVDEDHPSQIVPSGVSVPPKSDLKLTFEGRRGAYWN